MNFVNIFKEKGFSPAPDSALLEQLETTLACMSPKDLIKYIKGAVFFDADKGNVRKIGNWYNLRQDLEVIPQYFSVAQAVGLENEQAAKLLLAMQKAERFDFSSMRLNIEVLTELVKACQGRDPDWKCGTQQIKDMLDIVCKDDGEITRAMGVTTIGLNAGMNLEQSTDIVRTIYDRNWSGGYGLIGIYDGLSAMATGTADGSLLHAALKNMMTRRGGAYDDLAWLQYAVHANTPYTQTDVLALVAGRKQLSDEANAEFSAEQDALEKIAGKLLPEAKKDAFIKSPEKYFPLLRQNRLIHGILPYRLNRSFEDGIADLHKLMKKGYAEGMFIFDPAGETWYSMGGLTKLETGRVRHEYYPYDVSKLSAAPVIVHVHPEEAEIMVAPPRGSVSRDEFRAGLIKFFSAMPSGADWGNIGALMEGAASPVRPASFIVTSTGLTEMRFPPDAQKIKSVAEKFLSMKDAVLLEFNVTAYARKPDAVTDHAGLVRTLTVCVNGKLPSEFRVVQHDYDSIPHPGAPKAVGQNKQIMRRIR